MRTVALFLVLGTTAGTAPAQAPHPASVAPVEGRDKAAIIVQGGITPLPGCGGDPAGTGATPDALATAAARKGYDKYSAQSDMPATGARSGPGLAIGPKQDDPAPPPPSSAGARGMLAIGPKQDDPAPRPPTAAMSARPAPLAIGPKQDDPAPPPPQAVRCTPTGR